MNKRVQWVLFILASAAALGTGLLLHREDQTPVSPQASQVLLAATFPDLGGQQQRLEQWKGKVLVVNFWAT
jgi:hypothetical protein